MKDSVQMVVILKFDVKLCHPECVLVRRKSFVCFFFRFDIYEMKIKNDNVA